MSKSLVEAIRNKYDPSVDEMDHNNVCVLFVPKSGPNIGPSGSLSLPQRLTVDHCEISMAGQGREISELCERVTELDLSKNHLTDWNEVFTIVQNVPNLHFLNLLMNQLDEKTTQGIAGTYSCMKNLVINSTMVSWNTVALLLKAFPSLSELHLSLNQFINVNLPEDFQHTNLTKLYMNQCQLCSWEEVVKLGHAFPSLDSLNLISTDLEALSDCDQSYQQFSKLTTLNVGETKLRSWEEIDKFRKFPALVHLRITGVPFLEAIGDKERRQHLVSRLPDITTLNGSMISEMEREEAERAFIRHFMDQEDKPARYAELEGKYGKLDPLVEVDMSPKTTMEILVKFGEKAELMEIDIRLTVKEFKKFLQNFTGLPPNKMRVYYIENYEGEFMRLQQLRSPNRTLFSLNMNEGDRIEIDKIC